MNIQPTLQKNTNFGKLYAPKKLIMFGTGKIDKKQLLESKSIRECAEKYDVFIRKGKVNGQIETARNTIIGAAVGTGFGALVTMALIDCGAPTTLGIFWGAIYTLIGTAFGGAKPHEASTYEYFVKGKKNNIETKEYLLTTPKDLNNIPSLTKEIEEQQ